MDGADYDGRTPMHLAASEGRSHVVKYLIDQGVFIGPSDRWGNTPLTDARRIENASIIALLERHMPHPPREGLALAGAMFTRRSQHLFLPVRDRAQAGADAKDALRPASV